MAPISIRAPVGIRNGLTILTNFEDDLDKVVKLFDSIPTDNGGTRDSIGAWAVFREFLIVEVAAQITIFQEANPGLSVDGAIDPGGLTIRRMNALSSGGLGVDLGVSARAVPVGFGFSEIGYNEIFNVVHPGTVTGTAAMDTLTGGVSYIRKLVRVENCSINWFGVVFKNSDGGAYFGREPHIFFTPTPTQGGYDDGFYDSFGGAPPWAKLWHDYTSVIGRQICLATDDQILVIPFYRTSQHNDLGNFLGLWREVIEKVVAAAIDSVDAMYLRDGYTFETICSSSFSNGWKPHSQFHEDGADVSGATRVAFDFDGQAAKPASNWRPAKGILYRDLPPPNGLNPLGNEFYVGNRWQNFFKFHPAGFRSHNACARYLVYHGVWNFCT